jgi:hypothetical protein
MPNRFIATSANAADTAQKIPNLGLNAAGLIFQRDTDVLYVRNPDTGALIPIAQGGAVTNAILGIAAGYKVARGENQQATASDTVVTGLATVVAVVISPRTVTVKQLFFAASIGDQAGTPAAGSILITSKKPTAVNDVTPVAATDFTDNIKVNWVAIGT